MSARRLTLSLAASLTGLSAGFFVTYAISVTRGLGRVDDVTYVQTFQAINASVQTPWFALIFFGSVPALVAASVASWPSSPPHGRMLLGTALGLYLVGVGATAIGNLPLNTDLADVVTLDATSAAQARAAFEDSWNRWNLFRTCAITASFALVVMLMLRPSVTDDAASSRPPAAARH